MRRLVLVLAILIFFPLNSDTTWAKAHHSKGRGKRNPPVPLQCYGGVMETHGHALSLSPALGHPLPRDQRSQFGALVGQDPVPLGQLLGLFKDADEKLILEAKLTPETTTQEFKSLAALVKKKRFKGPVHLKLAAVLDKSQDSLKEFSTDLIRELGQKNLEYYKANVVSRWSKISDEGDESVFLQLELKKKTVFIGLELHDGSQDCLTTLSKKERKIVPEGVSPTSIPDQYLFQSPVTPPYDITYFFGPRIFTSMNTSMALERDPDKIPMSLPNKKDRAMDFLNEFWQFHSGVDFSVSSGTPVSAASDGVVFAMGPMGCSGNTIVLAHSLPKTKKVVFTVYEHLQGPRSYAKVIERKDGSVRVSRMSETLLKGEKRRTLAVGDRIQQGEVIALSGKSGTKVGFSRGFKEGCVGGAHLHFEVRIPSNENLDLKNELSLEGDKNRTHNMAHRFRFVQTETVAINPADFVRGIDVSCQNRKSVEIQNVVALKKIDVRKIPPITAGLCGLKYERSLKSIPSIYRLKRKKAEPQDENLGPARLANASINVL